MQPLRAFFSGIPADQMFGGRSIAMYCGVGLLCVVHGAALTRRRPAWGGFGVTLMVAGLCIVLVTMLGSAWLVAYDRSPFKTVGPDFMHTRLLILGMIMGAVVLAMAFVAAVLMRVFPIRCAAWVAIALMAIASIEAWALIARSLDFGNQTPHVIYPGWLGATGFLAGLIGMITSARRRRARRRLRPWM